MSNNRKRNLKKLARNILGTTAALSALMPIKTSAAETQTSNASNGGVGLIAPAGLLFGALGSGALVYNTYNTAKNAEAEKEAQKQRDQLSRDSFDWTKKSTPDAVLIGDALRGTGIDGQNAASAYRMILHLPRKSKSIPSLKQEEFAKILMEKDTLGGKIANAVYDEVAAHGANQQACNRVVYKTVAEFLRGGSKLAADSLIKMMSSKTWVEGKKPEKIVEGIGTIGLQRGHAASQMLKSIQFTLTNNQQNLVIGPGMYAWNTSLQKDGAQAGANHAAPGAAMYYGPEKLQDMHYELGNSWLGGSCEKLLKDALPMAFVIPKPPAWDGYEAYAATAAATRDECKAGLLGKKTLVDAHLDPFIKGNVADGKFCPNLVIGSELTTAAAGVNAIGGNVMEHKYFVPLDKAEGDWTYAKLTEGRRELGKIISGATMIEKKEEGEDEGLKL